jgi:hypothetical protein
VLGIWLLCTLAGLAFVAAFQRDVPHRHDFDLVEVQAGAAPLDWEFLWQPVRGHRKPLPRLFHLGLLRVTGGDLRFGSYLAALTIAGLSLAMVGAARSVRGYTRLADAFFPLLLQTWGHHPVYLRGFHLHVSVSVALVCICWLRVPRTGWKPGGGSVALLGSISLLLPLLGAWGPFYALTPLVVLVGAAVSGQRGRDARGRAQARACLVAAGLGAAGLVAYLYGLPQTAMVGEAVPWMPVVRTFLRFFAMSFGAASYASWTLPSAITMVAVVGSVVLLVRAWITRPERRIAVLALLGFLGSSMLIAAAIALGRGPASNVAGLAARYGTAAAAVLCATFFAFELGAPTRVARVAQSALLASVLLLLPSNLEVGLRAGNVQRAWSMAFERDVERGVGPGQLALSHPALDPRRTPCYRAERLFLLMQARAGIFRSIEGTVPDDLRLACPEPRPAPATG